MTENDLVREIRDYCQAHADPAAATKYARYFNEGYDAWGMLHAQHPFFNEKESEWKAKYSSLGLPGFLKSGALLFESGKYEEGAIAIRFVKPYRDKINAKALRGLGRWFEGGIRNWAHTDVLCGDVIAPALAAGQITLKDLEPWRASQWKFQRRASAVALLNIVKDGANVLDFLRPLMTDPERVVHQGTGWVLREAWKKNAKPVEAFLLEWKDTSPRLIFQYATEKMTPAQKARFASRGKARRKG